MIYCCCVFHEIVASGTLAIIYCCLCDFIRDMLFCFRVFLYLACINFMSPMLRYLKICDYCHHLLDFTNICTSSPGNFVHQDLTNESKTPCLHGGMNLRSRSSPLTLLTTIKHTVPLVKLLIVVVVVYMVCDTTQCWLVLSQEKFHWIIIALVEQLSRNEKVIRK